MIKLNFCLSIIVLFYHLILSNNRFKNLFSVLLNEYSITYSNKINLISLELKTWRMRMLPQGLFSLKIINSVIVPKMVDLCKSSTSVPNRTLKYILFRKVARHLKWVKAKAVHFSNLIRHYN